MQALHLKRQSQSEALEALDKTTNKMILGNEMIRGVTETQKVQEEASQKKIEGTKHLEDLNRRIKNLEQ